MSDVTDVVKALTELSSQLRAKASGGTAREYDRDVEHAYHDAADMVDAVMVGPAIQAALDAIDAKVESEVGARQYIDQDAAAALVDKLTGKRAGRADQ